MERKIDPIGAALVLLVCAIAIGILWHDRDQMKVPMVPRPEGCRTTFATEPSVGWCLPAAEVMDCGDVSIGVRRRADSSGACMQMQVAFPPWHELSAARLRERVAADPSS